MYYEKFLCSNSLLADSILKGNHYNKLARYEVLSTVNTPTFLKYDPLPFKKLQGSMYSADSVLK